jgi:hypothetical protein
MTNQFSLLWCSLLTVLNISAIVDINKEINMANSNRIRTSQSSNNTSEYPERYRRSEKLKKSNKAIKVLALAALVFAGSTVGHDKVGNILQSLAPYSSVDKDIPGPKVKANGMGEPDVLMPINFNELHILSKDKAGNVREYLTKNNVTIGVWEIHKGDTITIEDGADIRTSPTVGTLEDGTKTTIATTMEEVKGNISHPMNIYSYRPDNNSVDSYVGVPVDYMKNLFPNVKFEDVDSDTFWVNSRDVDIDINKQ